MNLQALQYIDINSVIAECLVTEHTRRIPSLVQRIEGFGQNRYVIIEGDWQTDPQQTTIHQKSERPLYLKAQPVFANSLLSTEIIVKVPYSASVNKIQNAHEPCADPSGLEHPESIDIPVDTDLHYRLQEPLPNYLGAQMYRQGIHVVLLLDDHSRLEVADTTLIRIIQELLDEPDLNKRSNARIVMPCFLDESRPPYGGRRVHLSNNVKIDLLKLAHFCHRLNVIGKSDLILCDSSGIAVDAIRSSVPAAFIAGVPRGYEKVQDAVFRFLQHKCRYRLLQEQRIALESMLHQPLRDTYVMSNQSTLRSMIQGVTQRFSDSCSKPNNELMADTMNHFKDAISQLRFQSQDDLILHTQHTMCSTTPRSVKLRTGLASSRRKYQKFRESPVRFMEDSQSTILRYLAANRN